MRLLFPVLWRAGFSEVLSAMLQALESSPKVVGIKQSLRAIIEGKARRVFLAGDAEERVRAPILEACAQQGVTPCAVETMAALGAACSIDVGAAVAVILDAEPRAPRN